MKRKLLVYPLLIAIAILFVLLFVGKKSLYDAQEISIWKSSGKIISYDENGKRYFCRAYMVSNQSLITASHCIQQNNIHRSVFIPNGQESNRDLVPHEVDLPESRGSLITKVSMAKNDSVLLHLRKPIAEFAVSRAGICDDSCVGSKNLYYIDDNDGAPVPINCPVVFDSVNRIVRSQVCHMPRGYSGSAVFVRGERGYLYFGVYHGYFSSKPNLNGSSVKFGFFSDAYGLIAK